LLAFELTRSRSDPLALAPKGDHFRNASKGEIPLPLAHFRFTPRKQTSTVYEYTP
jgi:hypothetical protein